MKIAIPVSDLDDKIGGGYTFESQLLAEIIKSSTSSSHEFILLYLVLRSPTTYQSCRFKLFLPTDHY